MLYYFIIHLLIHSTQQLFTGCRWGQHWERKRERALVLTRQDRTVQCHRNTALQTPRCQTNAAGRNVQSALSLLCEIMEAYPAEEALSQDVSDEPKMVRLINVLVSGKAFQMDGIAQGYQSTFFQVEEMETQFKLTQVKKKSSGGGEFIDSSEKKKGFQERLHPGAKIRLGFRNGCIQRLE